MTQFHSATIRDGLLVPDEPVQLQEGHKAYFTLGADPQQLPEVEDDSPEAIAARLARFDAIEPMQMADEELAEWEAARAEIRRVTLEAVRKEMGLPQ
jgi:hypothetical protein